MVSTSSIPLLFGVVATGLLAFSLTLMVFARFRLVDCIPLLAVSSVVFFLSRYNLEFAYFVGLRMFPGIMFLMLAWIIIIFVLRIARGIPPLPHRNTVLIFLSIFIAGALISGLVNSPNLTGFVAPLHVLFTALLPIALSFALVSVVNRNRKSYENLVTSFILFCGVLLPFLMLVGAIAPDSIGRFLGWRDIAERHSAGFSTARTPVGSGIASAMVVNIAYGFALCRFLNRKQWLNFIPIALCGFALMFSLQRSAMATFVLFNAVFFIHAARKHLFMIITTAILCVITLSIASRFIPEHYNFNRFFSLGSTSDSIRFSGITGAWVAGFKAPILGHGPGLLYHQYRTTFVVEKASEHNTITIEGYQSAQEPHNTYAFLAAEFGIIGLSSFLGCMIYLWRKTQSKNLNALSSHDLLYKKMYNAQWIAYFAGMYTHSTPLGNMKAAMFFWIFVAMGLHWVSCCAADRRMSSTFPSGIT